MEAIARGALDARHISQMSPPSPPATAPHSGGSQRRLFPSGATTLFVWVEALYNVAEIHIPNRVNSRRSTRYRGRRYEEVRCRRFEAERSLVTSMYLDWNVHAITMTTLCQRRSVISRKDETASS